MLTKEQFEALVEGIKALSGQVTDMWAVLGKLSESVKADKLALQEILNKNDLALLEVRNELRTVAESVPKDVATRDMLEEVSAALISRNGQIASGVEGFGQRLATIEEKIQDAAAIQEGMDLRIGEMGNKTDEALRVLGEKVSGVAASFEAVSEAVKQVDERAISSAESVREALLEETAKINDTIASTNAAITVEIKAVAESVPKDTVSNASFDTYVKAQNAKMFTLSESIDSIETIAKQAVTAEDLAQQAVLPLQKLAEETGSAYAQLRTTVSGIDDNLRGHVDEKFKTMGETFTKDFEELSGTVKLLTKTSEATTQRADELADAHEAHVQNVAQMAVELKGVSEISAELRNDLTVVAKSVVDTGKAAEDAFVKVSESVAALEVNVFAEIDKAVQGAAPKGDYATREGVEQALGLLGEEIRAEVSTSQQTLLASAKDYTVDAVRTESQERTVAINVVVETNKTLEGRISEVQKTLQERIESEAAQRSTDIGNGMAAVEQSLQDSISAVQANIETAVRAAKEDVVENAKSYTDEALMSARTSIGEAIEQVRCAIPAEQPAYDDSWVRRELNGVHEEMRAQVETVIKAQLEELKPELSINTEYDADKQVLRVKFNNFEPIEIPLSIGVRYRGVYSKDEKYEAGDLVTWDGSLWAVRGVPTNTPGNDPTAFQLAVKAGQKAREVKYFHMHEEGNGYKACDILKHNGRIWMCAKDTRTVPEAAQVTSSKHWNLIGGAY